MNFAVEEIGAGAPFAALASEELLVVLGPPQGERAPWIRALIAAAEPSLGKRHHYLTYQIGLAKQGQRTVPYCIVSWDKAGNSALERRWLAHKLGGQLAALWNYKRLAIYLEAGSAQPELAIAEDLCTRHMTPRYQESKLEGVRILTADAAALNAADPYRAARFDGQIAGRQWLNENPDELTSIVLGERLAQVAKRYGSTFETLGLEELAKHGMNLLLAVGQASDLSPSRLHLATHNLDKGGKPLLLVGKGITFDTGGINLKAHENHVNAMKNDMGGAATMISLYTALVASGYPGPLAVAIPCCENLIDGRAMKPGAIVRSAAGKDVIIEHTDAEGRLILADALHYAQGRFAPALTVVAATLTTASLRQFSHFFTAVHFANAAFEASLAQSGAAWGEGYSFWGEFLPFLEGNKTPAADLTNMGRLPSHANIGGACNVAAHFLKEFASRPMIHIDLFATTWNWGGDYPGAHYGATGAPFNSLFSCLRDGKGLWGYH